MTNHWGPFDTQPNLVLIITDQQRTSQHFPAGWAQRHLPCLHHLHENGVTFKNAMASATACSPSRSTLFTSTYPPVNGVLNVNATLSMSRTLPMRGSLTTLGRVLTEAGYQMAYKGKWHLDSSFADFSKLRRPSEHDEKLIVDDAFDHRMTIEDEAMDRGFSFPAWTSPDLGTAEWLHHAESLAAGEGSALNTLGGGTVNNDERIVNGELYSSGQKTAVDFLREYDPNSRPFCLIVSMANPHDVWVYPNSYKSAGYDRRDWTGPDYEDFQLPETYRSDLKLKPSTQSDWLELFQEGPLGDQATALEYVKFYAYLHTLTDKLSYDVIKAIGQNRHDPEGLIEDTIVVRFADHGEMAMAQGGQRGKENNCYDETIRVPLIFANPKLPKGKTRESLVGLIDVMPTLAEIAGVDDLGSDHPIQGRSFANELLEGWSPQPSESRRSHLFVTDDCAGKRSTSIRTIVEKGWKYAVYYWADYDTLNYNGQASRFEYELYDTANDPHEKVNLLPPDGEVFGEFPVLARWQELHAALTELIRCSYTMPDGWPSTVPPPPLELKKAKIS